MDDRRFLHEGEVLLCGMHPSVSHLIVALCRGILDTLIIGIVLSILMALAWWYAAGATPPVIAYVVLLIVIFSGVSARRWKLWKHSSFRVTTERILVDHHDSIFSHPLRTVKWAQYQESYVGRRTIVDFFFGVRPLVIRFGTADGQMKITFPAIPYADDLKHYLDKADSAVRKNDLANLRPFVPKPRGKRDELKIDN